MLSFIQLTTEVAPGAGTKLLAIKNSDGTYTQVVALIDSPTSTGSEKFVDGTGFTTNPGTPQDLIDDTVPAGFQRLMSQVIVACGAEGSFVVTASGAIIGEGRTGPGSPIARFTWNPNRPLAEGTEVKVTFTGTPGTAPRRVSAFLQATDSPI